MAKVYVLIDCSWDALGGSFSDPDHCIGIFTSQELVTKAANDYLVHRSNTIQDYEKVDYMMPEIPITFEELCESFEYYNHAGYYGARLYVYEHELDKLEF